MNIVKLTEEEKKEIINKAVETAASALIFAMKVTDNPNFIESEIYTEPNQKGDKYKLDFRKH